MTYLLDADTINYIVKNVTPVKKRFREANRAGSVFILSPIVHFQIVRYFKLKEATKLSRFYESLVSRWVRAEMYGGDWNDAADLWAERHRAGKPIQDADLLIAITARKMGAILVTNNTRHFDGLGLSVENWTLEG